MKKVSFAFMALLFVAGATYAQTGTVKKTTVKKMVIPKQKGPDVVPLECKLLHIGTFKTTLNAKTTVMVRTATTETDYLDGNMTNPAVYNIKWKSECEYVLTPTPETFKKHPEIPKGAVFTVTTYLRNTNSWTQTITPNYTKGGVNMDVYKVK